MKTKTYVLTLSTHFPKGHPREGEETHFDQKFICGQKYAAEPDYGPKISLPKIHTIRANYELWKRRIDEVNAGRAVLSVRQWLGLPRRSKQRELFRLDRDSGIGVERLDCNSPRYAYVSDDGLRGALYKLEALAENDGLTLEDWENWFRDYDKTQPMAIIHFTDFRYCR